MFRILTVASASLLMLAACQQQPAAAPDGPATPLGRVFDPLQGHQGRHPRHAGCRTGRRGRCRPRGRTAGRQAEPARRLRGA